MQNRKSLKTQNNTKIKTKKIKEDLDFEKSNPLHLLPNFKQLMRRRKLKKNEFLMKISSIWES